MFKKNIFNKKQKAILTYESVIAGCPNIIVSAKTVIPDWYKKIPLFYDNKKFDNDFRYNKTLKTCVPFLESLSIGYVITLPFDLYVEKNNDGNQVIIWPDAVKDDQAPDIRQKSATEKLVPIGHSSTEFVWRPNVSYTVPKGYSVLFTHPLNRHDLPFTTLTAVIDGGLVLSHKGNLPFYLKKDFIGIIEKGTPIAQLIPFRQEKWKSENKIGLVKIGQMHNDLALSVFKGWYKKTFWVKKDYD
jgi:hypothetical protein